MDTPLHSWGCFTHTLGHTHTYTIQFEELKGKVLSFCSQRTNVLVFFISVNLTLHTINMHLNEKHLDFPAKAKTAVLKLLNPCQGSL